MSWLQTYTGRAFTPLSPKSEQISIEDIAHSLAMQCRYNGHTTKFYSVAEHCYLMSRAVAPDYAIHALLHDSAEAYIGDIVRPLKHHLAGANEIEYNILDAILERLKIIWTCDADTEVRKADIRMLATERKQVMAPCTVKWESIEGIEPYNIVLPCWTPGEAEIMFLKRFRELAG